MNKFTQFSQRISRNTYFPTFLVYKLNPCYVYNYFFRIGIFYSISLQKFFLSGVVLNDDHIFGNILLRAAYFYLVIQKNGLTQNIEPTHNNKYVRHSAQMLFGRRAVGHTCDSNCL